MTEPLRIPPVDLDLRVVIRRVVVRVVAPMTPPRAGHEVTGSLLAAVRAAFHPRSTP